MDLYKTKGNYFTREYECANNYRYYEIGNDTQQEVYTRMRQNGCCGFYDEHCTINGKFYKIGFNFGH